ncbi:hypothetical protein HYFRA_00012868 [Hymenoscyphus fraxineus]|uniref:Uncharacterized protein n=1 Tax=Hymenoscyphus fraxineus TaxID=746836 RepID=A0A9N9L7S1_9HELO|nr:hypothetical protein HYFRA_00012868 [Hymenoscyphus fraxineus]
MSLYTRGINTDTGDYSEVIALGVRIQQCFCSLSNHFRFREFPLRIQTISVHVVTQALPNEHTENTLERVRNQRRKITDITVFSNPIMRKHLTFNETNLADIRIFSLNSSCADDSDAPLYIFKIPSEQWTMGVEKKMHPFPTARLRFKNLDRHLARINIIRTPIAQQYALVPMKHLLTMDMLVKFHLTDDLSISNWPIH